MVNPNAGNYPSLNLTLYQVAACAPACGLLFVDLHQPFMHRFDFTAAAAAPQPTFHIFRMAQ